MLFLCTIYWYFFQGIQEPIVFKKRLIVGLIRGHSAYIILTVMMILGFIFLKMCFLVRLRFLTHKAKLCIAPDMYAI